MGGMLAGGAGMLALAAPERRRSAADGTEPLGVDRRRSARAGGRSTERSGFPGGEAKG